MSVQRGAQGLAPLHNSVTLNARQRRAQREPCLFQYANGAARQIHVHMLKCASCTVFLLGQMGTKTGLPRVAGRVGRWGRHANILGRKRSQCINNHLSRAVVVARTFGIESISSTVAVPPSSFFSCFHTHWLSLFRSLPLFDCLKGKIKLVLDPHAADAVLCGELYPIWKSVHFNRLGTFRRSSGVTTPSSFCSFSHDASIA